MASHANVAQQVTVHMTDLGWNPDTIYLAVLPMFHLEASPAPIACCHWLRDNTTSRSSMQMCFCSGWRQNTSPPPA